MTLEEKHNLTDGERYFKAIFDDVEGGKDVIGYYRTYKEAVKACKEFAQIEIEYFYDSEFDVVEFEVAHDESGQFHGHRVNAWSNDNSFKMYQYIKNGERI